MGRCGRKDSLRALGAAWESGINFFDTARCYGYGDSEALLGEFLQGRRENAIISTKFGIVPSRQPLWKRVAKPIARGVLSIPGGRSVLGRLASNQMEHDKFTTEVLRGSIEDSLRALRTDYIDLLFMHDAPLTAYHNDDLLGELDNLVTAGKVRVAGISTEPEIIKEVLQDRRPPVRAVQFRCNLLDFSVVAALEAHSEIEFAAIANQPFGGVGRAHETRAYLRIAAASPETPHALRQKLASVDDAVLADVALNTVLSGTGIHVAVAAMIRPNHIATNVKAIMSSCFTSSEIEWLRTHVF